MCRMMQACRQTLSRSFKTIRMPARKKDPFVREGCWPSIGSTERWKIQGWGIWTYLRIWAQSAELVGRSLEYLDVKLHWVRWIVCRKRLVCLNLRDRRSHGFVWILTFLVQYEVNIANIANLVHSNLFLVSSSTCGISLLHTQDATHPLYATHSVLFQSALSTWVQTRCLFVIYAMLVYLDNQANPSSCLT